MEEIPIPILTPPIQAPQNPQYVIFLYVLFKVIAILVKFVLHLNFVVLINIVSKCIWVFSMETPFLNNDK